MAFLRLAAFYQRGPRDPQFRYRAVGALTVFSGLLASRHKSISRSGKISPTIGSRNKTRRAIAALIEMMEIKGAVVTIDAKGCRRAVAEKILGKKADYIFLLKGSRGTLQGDVKRFVAERQARNFNDAKMSRHEIVDGDHGLGAQMIRDQWTVENNLRWVMDTVFRGEECRVHKDHAAANFVTIKHAAFNFLKRAPGKDSKRVKRKRAAWEDAFL